MRLIGFFLVLFSLNTIQLSAINVDSLLLVLEEVKKKNPLVMPPDYNSLPKPKKKGEEIAQEEDFELKKILGEDTNTTKNDSSSNTDGDSLEKSILKKINVN